ncbi:unnamed protein product [Cylicostephanus goldi]|uniref:EB domain-containing protein n=1 Tax=Cylicostephanus goldi TaxID=71465 RepID=A0A3P7MMQ5_CYLGO|nr:unnamed protein product [Cylicostephanus goldi]
MCLRTAAPGAACLKSEQCLGGSLCESGICECPNSTVPIGGFCQEEIRSLCIKDVCVCEAPLTELFGKCVSVSARSKIEKSKVCPTGRTPYLLNGLPQQCTSQRCPKGYDCTYRDQDYICCSSTSKAVKRVTAPAPVNDQCPRGGALIYPSTRMPVICIPGKKGCPPG